MVDKGVYGLVRHPQYLGYTLLVLSFCSLDPHPLTLGLAGGASVFFYVQSMAEENFCRENLGPEYGDYMKRVPRFNFLLGVYRIAKKRLTKA